ncbi:MAG: hypothetical protein ACYC6Y_20830 [Thermoguttaceae bacterium]
MNTPCPAARKEEQQHTPTRRRFLAACALGACGAAVARGGALSAFCAETAESRGSDGAATAIDESVEKANRELWRRFVDPRWHTIYNHAGLDGKVVLPTPEECLADKPNALSWDISISDGAMFGGLYMEAAIHRWRITRQPEDREKAVLLAEGLLKLATVGKTKGFIARGLTADGSAHYALSSNDQTLPWLYGMWRYLRSDIPDEDQRRTVKDEIVEVVEALESHGWRVPSDRPPFDYFGSFGDFGWNGAPRLLFLLKMAADVSGQAKWEEIYRQAVAEKAPAGKTGRLETCRKGMVSALATSHTWTASPGVVGLRGLWELEKDPALKAAYEEGLRASATVAAESLSLAAEFDNDDRQTFLLDWHAINTLWHPQSSVKETLDQARKQLDLLDSLSPRRGYEVRLMREPLFAAWVVALCPDAALVREHAPAIRKAIGHYRWERLYLSQFFAAEAAYYRLKLSGLA